MAVKTTQFHRRSGQCIASSVVVTADFVCVVCGCRLTADNSSEVKNVCCSCLHTLEF